MNNLTTHISITKNFFHQYLLGESLKHIFIRFIFILSIIIIVWCCIIIISIIYIKYQKRKQIKNLLFNNKLNSTKNNFKRHSRFHSSSTSILPIKSKSIYQILPQIKRKYAFRSRTNENFLQYEDNNLSLNSNKTQTTIEKIPRRSFFIKKFYSEYQSNNELHFTETYSNIPPVKFVLIIKKINFSSRRN